MIKGLDQIQAVNYARCGKKIFFSRKFAKNYIKNKNKGNGLCVCNTELKAVYYCEKCEGWHVTSMDKRESRKMANKRLQTEPKPVAKYLNNMLIERYESVGQAARANGVTPQTIKQTINSKSKLNGLIWKFVQ